MVSSFLRPFLASLLLSDCHSQKYGTIRTPEKKIKCEEKHNEFIFLFAVLLSTSLRRKLGLTYRHQTQELLRRDTLVHHTLPRRTQRNVIFPRVAPGSRRKKIKRI